MADTAAFLVDEVLPDVPVRQWVLSLPHRVRLLCAYDPAICRAVRAVFVRAVANSYRRAARRAGLLRANTGAVVVDQRFDSALRLDLHFHGLFTDGVFTCALGQPRADFHAAAELTDDEVARTVRHIQRRVLRLLRKLGKLDDLAAEDPDVLLQIHAAATQGKVALGPAAGTPDARPGRGSMEVQFRHGEGSLCADLDGFSLHAAVRVPAGRRSQLEHLIRYVTRPPIVEERLSILPDGRVTYAFRKPWRDGSTGVTLDPLTFLERLAALVPRPRRKLVNYFGVFASAASYRRRVVPPPPEIVAAGAAAQRCAHDRPDDAPVPRAPTAPGDRANPADPEPADSHAPESQNQSRCARPRFRGVPHAPRKRPRRRRYYFWAELMRRVFFLETLTCGHCGGRRRLLTFLTDPLVIQKILRHLGLPAEPPELAPARPPPARSVRFWRS
jgi:hypothetical protein